MCAKPIKKKKLGSYPYASVIFSMTLALFILGLVSLLILQAHKLSEIIVENIVVKIDLKKSVTPTQRTKIEKELYQKPYILSKEGKPQIQFISKEEAAKEFMDETGENFIEFLGHNPLKDAYVVRIKSNYQDTESLKRIKSEVEQVTGVFKVHYVENLITAINKNLTKISIVLIAFEIIILIVIVILINNTIKLALFSQRFLIRSMQLVGAKTSFIQKPFFTKVILQGIVSGLIASIALIGVMEYAKRSINNIEALYEPQKILIVFGILLVFGAIIGAVSTWRAINKYLKISLDELY